ncbi:hypothetical protein [Isoptericola sp. BMS4]|uniref:hypothetical protein n=1 Tax=Isoptericola sp. BMS4 TaxID=2527875 RepID=UPI00141FE91F|nr:hypothetical protein [Isoptericola sp. BMS4]
MTTDDDRLPLDEVTREVRRLARTLPVELGAAAQVSAVSGDGRVEGFSVRSETAGSVEVWMMHDAGRLVVGVDDCPGWDLPRTPESVAVLRAVVDAGAAGRIEVGAARGRRSYRVPLPDGTVMEDGRVGLLGTLLEMPWKPRVRWSAAAAYGA